MPTILSRSITPSSADQRAVIAPMACFPALKSDWPEGVTVLCVHCRNILIECIHSTISIYRLAFKCPYCQKFSEVNLAGDSRTSGSTLAAFSVKGVIRLETPINPPSYRTIDGSPGQDLVPLPLRNFKEEIYEIRLEIQQLAQLQKEELDCLEFHETLLEIFHRFAFYGRQHSAVFGNLNEEEIRDLLLILLKVQFNSAEGEAYNFNGKTDVKVTNPRNPYEFAVAEFKWWRGSDSFREVYSQCVREHATGQEASLFILVLNSNFEANNVFKQTIELCRTEPETVQLNDIEKIVPSSELFCAGKVKVRDREIPLILGLIDLFFKNVRERKPPK
jgi:hypothetical protein